MTVRYVPNLRWKRGERNALSDLSAAGKVNVLPLFLLGSDQFKSKKATATTAEIPAPKLFAEELSKCWGNAAFYLDASPIAALVGHPHKFIEIAAECRHKNLTLIPAIRLGATQGYLDAIQIIAAQDGRGASLRVTLQDMSRIPDWIASWPFPLQETDLLIDLMDQAANVAAIGDAALKYAFQNLHQGPDWRSVIIVGTSLPENFAGLDQGLYTIQRHEKVIWDYLNAVALPYQLHYGDYATVSTAAPPAGIAWGYPISVKYTLRGEFLICRGIRTTGLGAQDAGTQLVDHAKSIATYHSRDSLIQCWADDEVNKIANETSGPKGLEHWVRIGVNRHIELVRSTLP